MLNLKWLADGSIFGTLRAYVARNISNGIWRLGGTSSVRKRRCDEFAYLREMHSPRHTKDLDT